MDLNLFCFYKKMKKKFNLWFSLPWNQSTPFGYLAETCYSFFVTQIYVILNGAIFLLFISLSLHFQAFGEMFQGLMRKLRNNPTQIIRNRKTLHEAMNLQSAVRRYVQKNHTNFIELISIYFLCYGIFRFLVYLLHQLAFSKILSRDICCLCLELLAWFMKLMW